MKDFHAVIPAARGSACGSLQVLPKTRGPDFPRLRGNDVQRQIRYQKFSEWAMYIRPYHNRLQAESDFSIAGSLY